MNLQLPAEVKTYAAADLHRHINEIKGTLIWVEGEASVEPLGGGRYAIRFWNEARRRLLVLAHVEGKWGAPLKGYDKGDWTLVVEGEVAGSQTGTVTLKDVRVIEVRLGRRD